MFTCMEVKELTEGSMPIVGTIRHGRLRLQDRLNVLAKHPKIASSLVNLAYLQEALEVLY
jgi:hypothetical protein